nr:hypothetical protein GCM10020093_057100 [Planobispora longispora]
MPAPAGDVGAAVPHAGASGQVVDDVGVPQGRPDEFVAGQEVGGEHGETGPRRLGHPVDGDDLLSRGEERLNQRPADESG